MKKQLIWVFEWRKSVHYWWSCILFSPECKELTSMLDPLLYRWGVPPFVIRCVHWTMQMWVLQTWSIAQGVAIVMSSPLQSDGLSHYLRNINIPSILRIFLSNPMVTEKNMQSVIRTLHDCPSQMNENLLIRYSKLTSDSELIWWP